MKRLACRNRGFALAACLAMAVAVLLPRSTALAGITYVYDADGHLTQVVNNSGKATTFSYDLDGNLTAIQDPSGEAVFQVSPNNGPPGTAVTIYGNRFGASPAVSFNGTVARVSSSTSTTIFVTVPRGAASGPVSVDSIAGPAFRVK